MRILLLIITVLCVCSCKEHTTSESHSSAASESPKEIHTANIEHNEFVHEDGSICKAQSPINILSFTDNPDGRHNITFHFDDNINAIENLGHTVQLDAGAGNTVTVDNETFELRQMHFHTPSEHLIDGITFPMEMHMVHVLQGQQEGETPQYLVIGVLFKMGKQSKFIDEFINVIPKEARMKMEVNEGSIKVADLISEMPEQVLESYYHYMGSLTTPPYTESVRWYVSKHIFEGSPEQINTILSVEGSNARQVQDLNDRVLESH